jgi:hypothetical protein
MKSLKLFLTPVLIILLFSFAISTSIAKKDTKKTKECNEEIEVQIKELNDFEETMHTLWHDGWTNKDMKLLSENYPKAELFVKSLSKVQLPKEMQNRSEKWEKGLKSLNTSLDAYKKAVDEKNLTNLLNAVEKFHSTYEAMVGLTKPYVKEVEEFHKYMAKLYHKDFPNFNLEEMKSDIKDMENVLISFKKVNLPKKYQPKKKEFTSALTELEKAVKDLKQYINSSKNLQKDDKALKDKVELLHTNFHTISEIFD